MANTVIRLEYANTFGDWVVTTNKLVNENNDLAIGNYTKSLGTLYLNSTPLSLQVGNNAIVAGQLSVEGIGSSVSIDNNLAVKYGFVYLQNTRSALIASGGIYANGANVGLYVANNILVNGSAVVSGNATIALRTITDTIQANTSVNTATLSVTGNTFTDTLQANTSVNTATLSVTGNSFTNRLQANTSVNTATLSVTGTTFTNTLQANTNVNTATLSVTGITFTNTLQANTSVNTSTLSVTGTTFTNALQANTNVNTATLSVTGTTFTNTLQANTNVNTATLSVTGTTFTNTLQANTNVNTATLSVTGTTFTNTLQANTSVNTATLSVTGNTFTDKLQANTYITTGNLNVTGTLFTNTLQATVTVYVTGNTFTDRLQANTSVNTAILSVTGNTFTNRLQANTSVNTATINTSTIFAENIFANTTFDANNVTQAKFNNIRAFGQLTVDGNFVLNGTTVYNTPTFTINAGSSIGQNSDFSVNRGTSGANATIRWDESNKYFAIRDVDNSTSFSKILTANLISDSIVSTSSSTVASSKAANLLNIFTQSAFNQANSANVLAQAAFDKANTANVLAQAAFNQANTANVVAQAAFDKANSANVLAQAAFNTANTDVTNISTTAGTYGNSTIIPVITVSANGRVVSVVNTFISGATAQGAYNTANNAGILAQAAFDQANTATNNVANSVTLQVGINATQNTYTQSAFNQANTANVLAQAAFNTANTDVTTISTTAGTYGNTSYVPVITVAANGRILSVVNTAISTTLAQAAFDKANTANVLAQAAFNTANTDVTNINTTAGTYGNTSYVPVITVAANGRIVSVVNTAISTTLAQNAYDRANTDVTNINTTAGTYGNTSYVPVITVAANGRISSVVNTAISTTLAQNAYDRANTDVTNINTTAGTYGNTSYVPVITVAANGRISSVVNTAISVATINNDTTTATTQYPLITSLTSGILTLANTSSTKLTYVASTGTLSSTVMTSTSDEKLKTNIVEISNALDTVNRLRGVEYEWIDNGTKGMGLIAQEVEKIIPYLISENEHGKSVMYSNMIGLLIEAIKELKAEVNNLKSQINR